MSDDDMGQGKCTECRGLRKVAQDCLKDCQRAEAEVERLADIIARASCHATDSVEALGGPVQSPAAFVKLGADLAALMHILGEGMFKANDEVIGNE